jgi:hypothetical protein
MSNHAQDRERKKKTSVESRRGKTAADCSRPIIPCSANRAVGAGVVAAARTDVDKYRVRQERSAHSVPVNFPTGTCMQIRILRRRTGRQPLATDHCLFVFCLGAKRQTALDWQGRYDRFPCRYRTSDLPTHQVVFSIPESRWIDALGEAVV